MLVFGGVHVSPYHHQCTQQSNQLELQWCNNAPTHTFVPNGTWMGRRAFKKKRKEEETAELQTKNNLKMIDFVLMLFFYVFLVVCLVGFLVDGFS